MAEVLLRWSNTLSFSQHGRIITRRNRNATRQELRAILIRSEASWIDTYVTLAMGVLLISYAEVRWWQIGELYDWVALTAITYVFGEMIQRNLNVVLFDHTRGQRPPASVSRSVIYGLMNYAQVIIGFGAFIEYFIVRNSDYVSVQHNCHFEDSLWLSTKAATLIDFPPNCGVGWFRTLFVAEAFVALFILVFLIAWGISNLPRRATD